MENQENTARRYNNLIWLLFTEYQNEQYTPSKFLLDSYKPDIDSATNGLYIKVHDSTLYDFKITKSVQDYIKDLSDITFKFDTSLLILSYTTDKYIVRDYYIANLAKLYTCSDVAYINCPCPNKITSKVFDYIITPDKLPDGLKQVIETND